MKIPEQICDDEGDRHYKKYLKKLLNRLRRRKEKRDPENAPTKKQYRGYST